MTVAEELYKANNPGADLRVFQLVGNGEPLIEIHIYEGDSYCVKGRLLEINGWNDNVAEDYDFIADFYIKWDLCSHFLFTGQDTDISQKEDKDDHDSYYHICGASCYINFFRAIAFATEVAAILMPDSSEIPEEIEEVRKFKLLEGFEIKEVK